MGTVRIWFVDGWRCRQAFDREATRSTRFWRRESLLKRTILFLFILMPSTAVAQTAPRTWVYAFGGTGGLSPDDVFTYWTGTTARAGVGVERVLRGGFGLLGELEYLYRLDIDSSRDPDVFLVSVNPFYRWGTGRLRPFVTGGYTALFGSHQLFNVNVGAGVNYRVQDRVAVRVEFRNHTLSFSTPVNSYGLRLGVGVGL